MSSTAKTNFPEPVKGSYKRMFGYFKYRGLDLAIIRRLVRKGLIYQERKYNSIVFINREQGFAETHSSRSFGKQIHGCVGPKSGHYWYFTIGDNPTTAFICESAINAISLYQLLGVDGYYISIAGVNSQPAIDNIKRSGKFKKIYLCLDNDEDSDKRRRMNPDLKYLIPKNNDWNDDLLETQSNQR